MRCTSVRRRAARARVVVLVAALISLVPVERAVAIHTGEGIGTFIANPDWEIELNDSGYADILNDITGQFPRELLSGEWAAALGYSYDEPIETLGYSYASLDGLGTSYESVDALTTVSPKWLEPDFIFPDWITNSDFLTTIPFRSTGEMNADMFEIYESAVANSHVEVRMTYQFWDTLTGIEQGWEPATPPGGNGNSITSNRYILQHAYEITNTSTLTLVDLKFFQFAHALNATEAVYDNRDYGGPFPDYVYDITQQGTSFDPISGASSTTSWRSICVCPRTTGRSGTTGKSRWTTTSSGSPAKGFTSVWRPIP